MNSRIHESPHARIGNFLRDETEDTPSQIDPATLLKFNDDVRAIIIDEASDVPDVLPEDVGVSIKIISGSMTDDMPERPLTFAHNQPVTIRRFGGAGHAIGGGSSR